ncbi:MAG: epoxyqueuosine reductase QueH [Clostridia bacterium]|nr:epoxyqueuosine reductase QueH [Clostridia bacterium]
MLDKTLDEIKKSKSVPKLLLHSCCAPCSSYCLQYLSDYFDITVLYFNPNIEDEEYERRLAEQKRFISEIKTKNKIDIIEGRHDTAEFYSAVKGLENEKEGGKRCEVCFRLRLKEAAQFAKENGFDYFTTTLSISPLKNATLLNSIGEELSREFRVKYLFSDFKKRSGYLRSIELSKEYSLYRQDYCGCVYSMRRDI